MQLSNIKKDRMNTFACFVLQITISALLANYSRVAINQLLSPATIGNSSCSQIGCENSSSQKVQWKGHAFIVEKVLRKSQSSGG